MYDADEITIEPWAEGKPHGGRVFAAIFPHSDDFTIMPGGLILKLLGEGYTGYYIRTTNDMMDSHDASPGETMHHIEGDMRGLAACAGIAKCYDLNYMNHYLSHSQLPEIRHRLITLFRFLQVDTVVSFDPCGHYEENPDHYITALAVEQACWMAECRMDLPELYDMGLKAAHISRKYYVARGPQLVNRVVDITPVLRKKGDCLKCNTSPITNMYLNAKAAGRTKTTTMEEYVDEHFLKAKKPFMGLTHYEKYHYIGP